MWHLLSFGATCYHEGVSKHGFFYLYVYPCKKSYRSEMQLCRCYFTTDMRLVESYIVRVYFVDADLRFVESYIVRVYFVDADLRFVESYIVRVYFVDADLRLVESYIV